ncbi:hypothetical protein KFZ56_16330 [Virgibacillus sp. NKC19-3]|uniref:hypothetical protein n=1 Tax=Virgibacillus saliphilus TaxID=2831674 RepID=UPI001C9A6EA9|nr:hypothetical protein [Virgibacillus sp. NKC19-3]MBY7144589.1 hypothetical protein [Virgibacillus sp. NKC19-3]
MEIDKELPLAKVGDLTDKIILKGVAELLEAYEFIDAQKLDIVEKFDNLEYQGFSDKKQIILSFLLEEGQEKTTATGIYEFTKDFLKSNFKLYDYVMYCLEKDFRDLVRENIDEMLNKHPDILKQYRLIQDSNNTWKIRAMTSSLYKNYDNNVVIYLAIIYLHQYAKKQGTVFKLENAQLSDSELRLIFQNEESINIDGLGNLYVGLFISNSEIKEKAFTFELRYKIVNENHTNQFGMIPNISDALVNVRHTSRVETMFSKMKEIEQLDNKFKETLGMIKAIQEIKVLDSNQVYILFEKILNEKDLSPETKKSFKTYYDDNLVNKTMGIIDLLEKTTEFAEDFDQRITLERIYYGLIMELLEKKKDD